MYAAARNKRGTSEVASVDMTTATVVPTVTLTQSGSTSTTLTFILVPAQATRAAYRCIAKGAEIPSAESILAEGTEADATQAGSYVVEELTPATDYVVVAAAQSDYATSEVATLNMTTAAPEAVSVTLAAGEKSSSSLTFTLTPVNAVKAAWQCIAKGAEIPSAEHILAEGTEADAAQAGTYTVKGLTPATDYVVVAAAQSDYATSEVAALDMTTAEPEPAKAGDFYYSDGTWSSEPVEGKNCVGIVFLAGRSTTKEGTDNCVYKTKDGSQRIDEVHGYVVALNNAMEYNPGVQWGSRGDDDDHGANTSADASLFDGYDNSQHIIARAEEKSGGLSDDADHNYPAAYYAIEVYETVQAAPDRSTGWFLPSARQLEYLYENYETIHASMDKLPAESYTYIYTRDAIFWSSTEHSTSYSKDQWAYMVNLDSANITPGYVSSQQKNKTYGVRSILVF